MSCAVLILFPAGGIIIRVLNHHHIVWIHAAFQMIAWVFYVAGAGMGIYLARNIFQVCLVAILTSPLRSTPYTHDRKKDNSLTYHSPGRRLPPHHRPPPPLPLHHPTAIRDHKPLPLPPLPPHPLPRLHPHLARPHPHRPSHHQRWPRFRLRRLLPWPTLARSTTHRLRRRRDRRESDLSGCDVVVSDEDSPTDE